MTLLPYESEIAEIMRFGAEYRRESRWFAATIKLDFAGRLYIPMRGRDFFGDKERAYQRVSERVDEFVRRAGEYSETDYLRLHDALLCLQERYRDEKAFAPMDQLIAKVAVLAVAAAPDKQPQKAGERREERPLDVALEGLGELNLALRCVKKAGQLTKGAAALAVEAPAGALADGSLDYVALAESSLSIFSFTKVVGLPVVVYQTCHKVKQLSKRIGLGRPVDIGESLLALAGQLGECAGIGRSTVTGLGHLGVTTASCLPVLSWVATGLSVGDIGVQVIHLVHLGVYGKRLNERLGDGAAAPQVAALRLFLEEVIADKKGAAAAEEGRAAEGVLCNRVVKWIYERKAGELVDLLSQIEERLDAEGESAQGLARRDKAGRLCVSFCTRVSEERRQRVLQVVNDLVQILLSGVSTVLGPVALVASPLPFFLHLLNRSIARRQRQAFDKALLKTLRP